MPYKDKCVSTCKQFQKSECNPPRCKYISGTKLKYCRLSHKYKMNKPSCNVTRRIKKKDIHTAARKTIGRMIEKSVKVIEKICSDSGECIAFGKNIDNITEFFKGFNNFDYVVSPINRIGVVSANGFVKEIEYKKQGYSANAILKSSQNEYADNLVYEYLVGIKYINRKIKLFPCFVQTYGLYFYNNEQTWKYMSQLTPLPKDNLRNLILQDSINYSKACEKSKYASILIQHIKNAKPLKELLVTSFSRFISYDLLYVLFIIYQALSSLSKTFTHYDLHESNILIYEPVKGKYIKYFYHNKNGTTTTFYSPYIPKIIDYGRCFFDNNNVNSHKIYEQVCKTSDCQPNCGSGYGFSWLNPESTYSISSSQKNESHDLRLLEIIKKEFIQINKIQNVKPQNSTFVELDKMLKKVVYGKGIHNKKFKQYGTEENTNMDTKKLFNVNSAFVCLKSIIDMPEVIRENNLKYSKMVDQLGELHIYSDDKPMKYIEY